ncbi:MAG TPA: translation elongation factor 4, partial [Chloroflexota bacterium]|nr:translation elongation factor 4 [Chloroflexota bacterium]
MEQKYIRNFSIIAHIDHGKTTLSDRLLESTGTITARQMTEQVLDSMDLEREKGITIKARAVRMPYLAKDGQTYELNLIDTPGHVDFSYEVSRSLAACEGALLVVDAVQGIEAQTLANTYLALDHDLEIIPVINKIDLPNAMPDKVAKEIEEIIGIPANQVLRVSAKEGTGIPEVLEALVQRIPAPKGNPKAPTRALIFDSHYDVYKGVIAYVRVVDGGIPNQATLQLVATGKETEALEIGYFRPELTPTEGLQTGEVGYVATGLKDVAQCQVGDTLTLAEWPAHVGLPGYRPAKPMVFAGLYPVESNEYQLLRDALEKLKLNDAALSFEPENSVALGFGFRCGFLGLLHMEIVQERLEREYGLNILTTSPSVEYQVTRTNGEVVLIDNPAELPPPNELAEVAEPWAEISIVTPSRYIGTLMELVTQRRGISNKMEYLDEQRVLLTYDVP